MVSSFFASVPFFLHVKITAGVTEMVLSVCKGMLYNHGVKIGLINKRDGFYKDFELILSLPFKTVVEVGK